MLKVLTIGFFMAQLVLGCTDAQFTTSDKKKSAQATPQPSSGDSKEQPKLDGDPSKATDCTGKSESECHEAKSKDNTSDSYRVVDCTKKSAAECSDAVTETKKVDGNEDSKIYVKNCEEDASKTCEKLANELNTTDKDITDNKIPVSDDSGSATEPVGDIATDDGSKKPASGDITDGDGTTKGTFVCIGGPAGNISYVTKTADLASQCISHANPRPCANDSKCGNFKLVVYPCTCNNPAGIPFTKDTNSCFRNNPLKGDAPTNKTGCYKK